MSADFPHRLRLRGLLLAITAVLMLPSGAPAAEKGLQTDLSWGTTAAEQERTLAALDGTGVQWLRLDISWRNTERTRGVYDADNVALTDHAIELAEAAGARIIMAVSESPEWASGSTNANTPPRDPADYANFVRDMAARYAGRVAAWEIWNEPNHPRFWNPAPDAAGYARLLKVAAPAVRAGDPQAKVLFGGLAHSDYAYLEQAYAAEPDLGDAFDVMATHPYTAGGQSPAIVDRAPDGRMTSKSFLAFQELRDVMRAHGDERPIWLTEFGWSTNTDVMHPLGGVTEAVQASYLALAFDLLEAAPEVEVAVVYNFRNNYWAADADTWEDQLGLLRTDFSPKPAYAVFRDYQPPRALVPEAPLTEHPAVVEQPALAERPAATAVPATPARRSITLSVQRLNTASAAIARRGAGRVGLRVVGRLSAASRGRARIVLERRTGRAWKHVRTVRAAIRGKRFSARMSIRRGQRWRVSAVHDGVRAEPVSIRG